MSFVHAISAAFGRYASFSGRATRAEFWLFWLLNVSVSVTLDLSAIALDSPALAVAAFGWSAALFLPQLSVAVRRLHDTDRSGWWSWLIAVPVVGPAWMAVVMSLAGSQEANKYGPAPAQVA